MPNGDAPSAGIGAIGSRLNGKISGVAGLEPLPLSGNRDAAPFPDEWLTWIPWLTRLRAVYMLLSRLWHFGAEPTDEQRAVLERIRGIVRRTAVEEGGEVA